MYNKSMGKLKVSSECIDKWNCSNRIALPNRGIALPTVLWVLLVISALGSVFLIFMSWGYISASKARHEQGAYYCAYSGIMYAKAKLDEDPAWEAPLPTGENFNIVHNGVTYGRAFITTQTAGGNFVITSEGRYGKGGKTLASRRIEAKINLTTGALEWKNL